MPNQYDWMAPAQKELYNDLCEIFDFQRVADLGKFLGLNNPYHGARLIFESKKPNAYLRKLVEIKKEANERIAALTIMHKKYDAFKEQIYTTISKVEQGLESVKQVQSHVVEVIPKELVGTEAKAS